MASAYEKVLIDSSHGFHAGEWEIDASEFSLSAKKSPYFMFDFFSLVGGRQDGVDLLHVDNGRFDFTVCPTRGMSIMEAQCDGVRLGWDSPVDEVVHPKFINQEGRGGIGWLEGFNEWVVRCGLTNNGAPFVDENGAQWPLHGRIANTPASVLVASVELEPPYTIRVVGAVRQVCMFQENLVLETEIATEPGADWIRITDRVTNLGGAPTPIQMLYHNNYCAPLMSEGAKLVIPASVAMPRDQGYNRESVKRWDRQLAPTTGIGEECWYVQPKADRKGMTRHMLVNGDGDLGVVQEYALKSLPCFAFWKNPGALEDGYVTGLEPSTNFPNPMCYEKKQKRVVNLRSGRSWESAMTIGLRQGRKAIAAETKKIKSIQGAKKTEVLGAPEKGFSPDA
ncbi:MAG: aldose 1-epimerase family protein [Planctomycetota bacterium]